MTDWHRLFGLGLISAFKDTPWVVELERELTVKQQLLDVLIVRRQDGKFLGRLPDGLENLADHNLLTYKSQHEPLDDWALKELTHHYVAYRQMILQNDLPAESAFRLFSVCTRFPAKLDRELDLDEVQDGVYRVQRDTDDIRVIVLSEIPAGEHNALWHLFSDRPALMQQAADRYRREPGEMWGVIEKVFSSYGLEGVTMPYTMQDFWHEYMLEKMQEFTPEERMRGLPAEEFVKRLPTEERLKGLRPEERLKGLLPEEIEAYLKSLRNRDSGN